MRRIFSTRPSLGSGVGGGPAFGTDVGALDGLPLQFMRQRQPNQVLGHAVRRVAVLATDVFAFV